MNKLSKRLLSAFLSLLMVITAVPAFVVTNTATATAATLDRDPSLNKYIYAYFSGNSGCQIRFAVSDDGYNFEALNSGEQILQTTTDDIITFRGKTGMGNQKGARDPFIIRKPDGTGFYIVATDLDTSYSKNRSGSGNEYNNTNILVWDLDSLTSAADVKPWSIDTSGWFSDIYFGKDSDGFLGIGKTNNYYNGNGVNVNFCAWAPEVVWDAKKNMYMMYWSACMYDSLRIRYAYTNDFRTFYKADGQVLDGTTGEPDILYDPGYVSIDGNITYCSDTGKYYMYYKNEGEVRNGNANSNLIRRVESDNLTGHYSNEITVDTLGIGLEGPEVYQMLDGSYVFMGDNFAQDANGGKFTFYKADNIADLKGGSDQYFGDGLTINHLIPSHGAMSYITTEEYNALIDRYGVSNFDSPALDDIKTVNDHLVARYFTTGNVFQDATGHGFNLTTANNISVESDAEHSNYAEFKGNNVPATQYQSASYGAVDTTPMLNKYNFNANDGVTMTWYANSKMTNEDGDGFAAYFSQAQSGVLPGSLTYNSNGSHYNTSHTFVYAGKPTFAAGGQGVGSAVYGSENTLDPPSLYTNGWHEFTVTYVNGFMNFFIDGKIYNTFLVEDSTCRKGSPLKISSINNQWFKDLFTGNLYFGASLFNGTDQMFTGSISDFRIYNKALNPDEIAASQRYLLQEEIGEAVSAFEEKLATSDVILTNYADAYKAYIECKKALDSLNYGTIERGTAGEQINYEALIDTLLDYSKSVTDFKTIKTVQVFDSNNSNQPINSKYANKLLYYAKGRDKDGNLLQGSLSFSQNIVGEVHTSEKYQLRTMQTWKKVIMSDFVMLYDGDEQDLPTAPLQTTFEYKYDGTGSNMYDWEKSIVAGVCDNKEFSLAVWHECPDINGAIWSTASNSAPYIYAENPAYTMSNVFDEAKYTSYQKITASHGTRGATHKWTGDSYLTLNPDAISFDADNNAYKVDTSISIYDSDKARMQFKASGYNSENASPVGLADVWDVKNPSSADGKKYNTNYGYIVNYVPVTKALQRALPYIKDVEKYQLDNVNYLALLQAIDEATKLDLVTMFDNSSNIETTANQAGQAVKKAADKIDAAIAKLEAEKTTVDNYTPLREEMDIAKILISSTNVNYTDESFAELQKIYADAQAFMDDVYGTNNTHTYESNNWNYNERVAAVTDALEHVLNEYVDTSELRKVIYEKSQMFDSNGNQLWTLKSWLDNESARNKGDECFEKYNNSPKYETEKATYINLAGETVEYDRVTNREITNNVPEVTEIVRAIDYSPVDSPDAYKAYNKAQEIFFTSDLDAYTPASVELITSYGNENTAREYSADLNSVYVKYDNRIYKNTTVGETDEFISSVLTTTNGGTDENRTRRSYKVTFNYVVDGVVLNQYTDVDHYYGDVVDMSYVGDGNVVSWSVKTDKDTPTYINNSTNAFSLKVQNDTVVNVYATTDSRDGKHEVKLLDYFGRAQVIYVPDGTTLTIDGETIRFSDGQSLTNQSCNYITFTEFNIKNGSAIKSDTKIIALGTKAEDTMTYKIEGGAFDDGSDVAQYKVDDIIKLSATNADDCIGLAIKTGEGKYTMLTYAQTFEFYGFPVAKAFNGTVELKFMTAAEAKIYNIDIGVPQSYGVGVLNSGNNKLSMYCMMSTNLSDNIKVVERGILASADASTSDTLIKGASNVRTLRSTSDIDSSMYMITFGTSGKVIYARSYVAYEQKLSIELENGIIDTVNIPLVAYGDVVISTSC